MKKVHTLAMLGIPFFLAAGFLGTRTTSEEAQQQQRARGPSYGFESQHFAMQDAAGSSSDSEARSNGAAASRWAVTRIR